MLPYFTPIGISYFDTFAIGVVLGSKISAKKRELIRTFLEGVTFEM